MKKKEVHLAIGAGIGLAALAGIIYYVSKPATTATASTGASTTGTAATGGS